MSLRRNQNVALTLQCDSVAFQPEEVKIQWEEVFRENVDISKKINFVTTCDSVALDQIAITIKDEANEEIVKTFGRPFPTPCKALPGACVIIFYYLYKFKLLFKYDQGKLVDG